MPSSFIKTALYIFIFTSITACVNMVNDLRREENRMPEDKIVDVINRHSREMISIKGVEGIAEGRCNDKPCIKVYVNEKSPELSLKIPNSLEGYPVMIEETGEIKALPEKRIKEQ